MSKREPIISLSSIKMSSLKLMTEQEKRETIGGDHTLAQLLTIFSNTTANGFDALPPTQYTYFTQIVSEINSTSIGHDMLEGLYTATSANPISLNFGPSIPGAYYQDKTHSLNFGAVGDLLANVYNVNNTADTEGMNFMIMAHEIFHAYEHLVADPGVNGLAYFSTIRPEVDSTLFSTMALKEYDLQGNGHNLLNQVKDARYYTPQLNTDLMRQGTQNYNSNSAFGAAWGHLIDNGNFTIADYNALVVNFATGANYTGSTGAVPPALTSPDATTSFFINEYFPTYDRNISADDGSTSTYSNGSGSSGSGGSSSFGSNDFGYATGFNGGGSTYSYNPVDFGGSWYGYGNAPATMVGNGGQQIRVDIEPY